MKDKDGFVFLSHLLTPETPGYGGKSGFTSTPATQICQGATANSQSFHFSSHTGTHIDFPRHFFENGKCGEDYPASEFVYSNPYLISRISKPNDIIGVEDWVRAVPENTDLLLLRTGFEHFRTRRVYWEENPGISAELGKWLRQFRPNLRAIGLDTISLTGYQNREIGRKAHRAFLDPEQHGRPILIIEDMSLDKIQSQLELVLASPLRIQNADGAAMTVFGKESVK